MKIGAFHFFERCHSNGTPIDSWVLAAWHWPWSVTWRWTFRWTPWRRVYLAAPFYWRWNKYGWDVLVRPPLIGEFSFSWQGNIRAPDSRGEADG